MIEYRTYQPQGILAHFIRYFWSLNVGVLEQEPFVHRALPDNCAELIFYCRGDLSIISREGQEGKTFPSGVFGQTQKFRQFKTSRDFHLFGVYLYPFAFKSLFAMPATDLSDGMIDSESLFGIDGKVLEEQVMLARDDERRVELVSSFILRKMKTTPCHEAAFIQQVRSVIDRNTILSITSFAKNCNLSRRQFERKFKDLSGFSPKDFIDVTRFKNVMTQLENGQTSLADIAIQAGYYDQSHLTNEFKRLSGYTPREYMKNCGIGLDTRLSEEFKNVANFQD
jgi:AraC-like DNA-binding protein